MEKKDENKISVERLISFFRKLKAKRPEAAEADYSRWNQTEDDYQQEQAEWLEAVRRKKNQKKPKQ
ncbi:MAG: hypothetical protein R6T92_02610 [Desulfosalsimonadaceae bacterium]